MKLLFVFKTILLKQRISSCIYTTKDSNDVSSTSHNYLFQRGEQALEDRVTAER